MDSSYNMPDPNKEPQRLPSEAKVARNRQPQSKDYKFIGSQRRYSREFMAGFTRNGDLDEGKGVQKFKRKQNASGTYSGKLQKTPTKGKWPSREQSYRGGV